EEILSKVRTPCPALHGAGRSPALHGAGSNLGNENPKLEIINLILRCVNPTLPTAFQTKRPMGVTLFAISDKSIKLRLTRTFANRAVDRIYWSIQQNGYMEK